MTESNNEKLKKIFKPVPLLDGIEEIRQAKDELIRMSNDSTQRELYDMRANSLRDKISELNLSNRLSGANGPVDTLDASDNVTVMGALSVGGGVEV